jgi:predicted metal-dependent HD superfamily phosphohydrolase
MKADLKWLREEWETLLAKFRAEGALVAAVFVDLVARYGEDGRYYHNLYHIQNLLETVATLREQAQNYDAIQLAVWFHDAIYKMQWGADELSNEERSANYAGETLTSMQLPADTVTLVQQLIRATQITQTPPNDMDFYILLDADLAILAAVPEVYDQYARAIRQEYAFVPEGAYRNGRIQILQSFLDRDHIYRTATMYQRCQQAARQNIEREILSLQIRSS